MRSLDLIQLASWQAGDDGIAVPLDLDDDVAGSDGDRLLKRFHLIAHGGLLPKHPALLNHG